MKRKKPLIVLGDKEDTSWAKPVRKCVPSWQSWSVLKDGLGVVFSDGDAVLIQTKVLPEYLKRFNEHCRKDVSDCAMLSATGKTCYEIMEMVVRNETS
ncbi:MAG: hypothetical protein Q7T57_04645 [Dehalococcoidales bacterium]|nr:hypothetical protein [Dehalococcoidales bacterium]